MALAKKRRYFPARRRGIADPFEGLDSLILYQSPDCTEADLPGHPREAFDYEALLQQARISLARRRSAYPQSVSEGRMDADLAKRDIQGWALLVREWSWIVEDKGAPPALDTLLFRKDAADLALKRIGRAIEQGNHKPDTLYERELLKALRWHLGRVRDGEIAVHFYTKLNRKLRGAPEGASARIEEVAANG